MSQVPQSSSTSALLLDREVKVLSVLTLFRTVTIAVLFVTTLVVAFSRFEQIATAFICIVYFLILIFCWSQIRRKKNLNRVGFIGVFLDLTVLALLPGIWYVSVGGSEVEPAYMLKTGLAPMALLFIVLNSMAMRAIYPLLLTMGILLIYLGYFLYIADDPRTIISSNYVQTIMGTHLHVGLLSGTLLSILGTGLILSFLAWSVRKLIYQASSLENANTRLGRYFSPNLVKRLVENPQLLKLGGERRELSFVFTDLESFTALTEKLDPKLLVNLLNDYLDGMISIAFKFEGTIDKIVGDAVHVIFGAPVTQHDHAQRALDCALAMDEFATKFASQKQREGIALGVTRIGVNCGTVMVGNFGGRQMFDYTAHGDAINVAARLESLNKQIGTRIAVSQDVVNKIDTFIGRPLGEFILRGKSESLSVYEPLTTKSTALVYKEEYENAYYLMNSNPEMSKQAFADILKKCPMDPPTKYHHDRLVSGAQSSTIRVIA